MAQTIELGVQLSFGNAGCPYKAEQSVVLAANANQTIANSVGAGDSAFASLPGWFMVLPSANDVVQYSPDGGTTWRDIIPSSGFGYVYSDGFNFRIHNGGVADVAGAAFTRLIPLDLI